MNKIYGTLIPIVGYSGWFFEIVDLTGDPFGDIPTEGLSMIDESIRWSEQQITGNYNTLKVGWNKWIFYDYKEAEKFLIFWKLKWINS